jgi:hypothetical protein
MSRGDHGEGATHGFRRGGIGHLMAEGYDNAEAIIEAANRLVGAALPITKERLVHGVRVWLPAYLPGFTVDKMDAWLWNGDETPELMLCECVARVYEAHAAIEKDGHPSPARFPVACDAAFIIEDRGACWLWAFDRCDDGRVRKTTLPIYALDERARWALTLHGVCSYGDGHTAAAPDAALSAPEEDVDGDLPPGGVMP